jgi:plastocyanin
MPSSKKRKNKGAQASSPAGTPNESAEPLDEAAAAARREQQRREWAQQKKTKERKPVPVALYAWLGAGGLAIAGAVILVVVLVSGGGGDDGGPAGTPVIDSRVAGLPVDQTEEVIADDEGQATNPTFSKTTIVGKSGDVIEITMPNVGSVAHNLHVAGEDNEYSDLPDSDDWITDPGTVQPGETGVVRVKIDTPGTYDFQCDFHPTQQRGVLILS